jgi:CheY-like chemotaxis protein
LKRVLIVDDEEDIREVMKLTVKLAGHEPVEADGTLQALEVLRDGPVDLVLLDLRMPEVDGWDFLRAATEDRLLGAAKVIVVSANADPAVARQALNSGCSAFIEKPFSPRDLRAAIEGLLGPA